MDKRAEIGKGKAMTTNEIILLACAKCKGKKLTPGATIGIESVRKAYEFIRYEKEGSIVIAELNGCEVEWRADEVFDANAVKQLSVEIKLGEKVKDAAMFANN